MANTADRAAMTDSCTWTALLGKDSWPCTGDHSAGAHHFEGITWTLPVAVTDLAERDRRERPQRPSGRGLDIEEVLARHGLAWQDGSNR
jgi:hypothetical protein